MATGLDAPIGHAWLSFSTTPMLRQRRERLLARVSGEQLDLGGRTGLSDVDAVLRGVRRVLREDGQFLFLEHVPDWPGARSSLDLIAPAWRMMGRCDPSRDIPEVVRRAGFVLMDLERFTVPTLAVPLRGCVAGRGVIAHGDEAR